MGPILYFSDIFNYVDLLIVVFGVVEMATSTDSASETNQESGKKSFDLKSLSVLRIFRIFRVLRLAKLLKNIKTMRKIISSMARSIENVMYILLLLFLSIVIFMLLGSSSLSSSPSFEDIIISFYTVFQILTMENWNELLFELYLF